MDDSLGQQLSSDHEQSKQSTSDLTLQSEEEKKRHELLMAKGTRLATEAKESNFQDIKKLSEGLKCYVEAVGECDAEAVSSIESFFANTPQDVLNQIPKDLTAVAHMIMEGTEAEKEIYTIAKRMFATMAKGASFIPKEEFETSINRLLTMDEAKLPGKSVHADSLKRSVKKLLHCGLSSNEKGERIVTEEAFCLVACRYARGEVLLESLEAEIASELTPGRLSDFHNANWIRKVTDFPSETFQYIAGYVLKVIEKYGVRWIWSLFPLKEFFFVFLIYVIPLVNVNFMLTVLASFVFSCSLVAMVVSTLQVVANSSKVSSFEEYSAIFCYFAKSGQKIDTIGPEFKLIMRSAYPYLTFTISTLFTLFTINLSYQKILIYELLVVIMGAMACIVFFHFSCWKSLLILLTLSTRLISWTLALLHVFQAWLPIPNFLFVFGWTIFSIPIFPGVYIDVNFTTLVQIPLQVLLIIYFISRYSWKNFFTGLGPYLLFVSWWIFCRYTFSHSSVFSLVIFIPGVLSVILFLPFLPLLILTGPFIVMLYYGISLQFLLSLFLLVIFVVIALAVISNYQRLKHAKWLKIPLDYLFLVHLVVGIAIVFAGTAYYNNLVSPSVATVDLIQFDHYDAICGNGVANLYPGNMIQSQLDCMHLKGRTVFIERAKIDEIKIVGMKNYQESALKSFPRSIRTALTCLMGESKPFCGNMQDSKTCVFRGCHFDYNNEYMINMSLTLVSSSEQTLSAQLATSLLHDFLINSSLLKLKRNDLISLNATLIDGLGTKHLILELRSLKAEFHDKLETKFTMSAGTFDETKELIFSHAWESFVRAISFVLEIVVGYSPSEYYKSF